MVKVVEESDVDCAGEEMSFIWFVSQNYCLSSDLKVNWRYQDVWKSWDFNGADAW